MSVTDTDPLKILDGDGDSAETPVLFGPSNVRSRVAAERQFIEKRFGKCGTDWTEQMHYTSMDLQSVWRIELADGTSRSVFFDTSNTTYDE